MKALILLAALGVCACGSKNTTVLPLVGKAEGTSETKPAAAQPVKVVPLSGNAKAHGGAK